MDGDARVINCEKYIDKFPEVPAQGLNPGPLT